MSHEALKAFKALKTHYDKLAAELNSDQYCCVGRTEDENTRRLLEHNEGGEIILDWDGPEPEIRGSYDNNGQCTEMLTVWSESEYGDFGSYLGSYIMMEGACKGWHRYGDGDGRVYDEILIRYSERQQILKKAAA